MMIFVFGSPSLFFTLCIVLQTRNVFSENEKSFVCNAHSSPKETCIITDILVQKCSNEEHYPVYRLSSRSSEIAHRIMEPSRYSWREIYGVELIRIGFENIILTQESKETYDKLRRAQMEQAFVQQPAQPQTPTAPAAWQCPNCGAQNTSKFCTNCGAKQGQ